MIQKKGYQLAIATVLLILGCVLIISGAAVAMYQTYYTTSTMKIVTRDAMEKGYTIEFRINDGGQGRLTATGSGFSIIPSYKSAVWMRLMPPGSQYYQPAGGLPVYPDSAPEII